MRVAFVSKQWQSCVGARGKYCADHSVSKTWYALVTTLGAASAVAIVVWLQVSSLRLEGRLQVSIVDLGILPFSCIPVSVFLTASSYILIIVPYTSILLYYIYRGPWCCSYQLQLIGCSCTNGQPAARLAAAGYHSKCRQVQRLPPHYTLGLALHFPPSFFAQLPVTLFFSPVPCLLSSALLAARLNS